LGDNPVLRFKAKETNLNDSRFKSWFGTAAVTLLCAMAFAPLTSVAAEANTSTPTGTVQGLCDALLESMKKGTQLDFNGRVKLLDPQLHKLYDLPLLTRLVVGPPWRSISPDDQKALVDAFSEYSTAVYAGRFKSYDKEKFEVDPTPDKSPSGDSMVKTKLYPSSGEPVQLNYLVRQEADGWHIIDVLLNGTISEMAERRSEYASTLRDGGAQALIKLLKQKTTELQQKK
jgi:phospholipid transport system substrate-binding protein